MQPISERPAGCGTGACSCPRSLHSRAYARWDAVADTHYLLTEHWLALRDISSASAYDVSRYQEALAEAREDARAEAARLGRMRGLTGDKLDAYVRQSLIELG